MDINLTLSDFDLNESNLSWVNDNTLIVRKWNWEYSLAHKFQRKSVELVQEHAGLRIFICTSHPHVLTNGRGLQKPRKGEELKLIDFKPENYPLLPFPLHQIERGGGLTFHHPGQFIFYPITRLNPKSLSLSKMTDEIFDFSMEVLSSWGVKDLGHENKLLGLWWKNDKKLASMGIAIEKLVTFHGMALNLYQDPQMKSALALLNPCGLSSDIYISAEELIALPENALDKFCDEFLEKVKDGWL